LKEECSFLKKRTKKLLSVLRLACGAAVGTSQTDKSLFASFSSEKEGSFLP
jgi:hypothetical protein